MTTAAVRYEFLFVIGLLFEMLTGQKAFAGKSQASLIASILERDPPSVVSVQPMSPPAFDRVVRQCLAKDPDERWQSAGDLRRALEWVAGAGAAPLSADGCIEREGAARPPRVRISRLSHRYRDRRCSRV